jgi:RNA recognition motif-containing protein
VKNIFVGSLSFRATEEDIRQIFSAYGTVDRVSIPMDRETGRSRGFGFVEMPNDAEADAAIAALNGSSHMGRTLNVNEARPKEGGGSGFDRGGGGGGGGGRRRGGGGGRGGYGDSGGY